MNIFIKELKLFSKQNWWIYIIFIICLFIIYKTGSWNIIEVCLVFMFHFIWDVFVMMMWDYYSKKENKKALYSQIWSFIIFWIIWIYAWLSAWKWSYLVPQILFFWPIIKWFNPSFKWLNAYFMITAESVVLGDYTDENINSFYLPFVPDLKLSFDIVLCAASEDSAWTAPQTLLLLASSLPPGTLAELYATSVDSLMKIVLGSVMWQASSPEHKSGLSKATSTTVWRSWSGILSQYLLLFG